MKSASIPRVVVDQVADFLMALPSKSQEQLPSESESRRPRIEQPYREGDSNRDYRRSA